MMEGTMCVPPMVPLSRRNFSLPFPRFVSQAIMSWGSFGFMLHLCSNIHCQLWNLIETGVCTFQIMSSQLNLLQLSCRIISRMVTAKKMPLSSMEKAWILIYIWFFKLIFNKSEKEEKKRKCKCSVSNITNCTLYCVEIALLLTDNGIRTLSGYTILTCANCLVFFAFEKESLKQSLREV